MGEIKRIAELLRENVERVIVGKRVEIDLIIAALLAGGHVLLDDVPGTGKTVLCKALARSLDCGFGRVQFTPDLLPSDLTGISFYNPKSGEFTFRKGALFCDLLLADEINRATPRTQSGLLESMEERQVTVDGVTYPLGESYFVIATQNPVETAGTYPLPEAQLDRFLIRLTLGYPTARETVDVLQRNGGDGPLDGLSAVCSIGELLAAHQGVREVFVHPDLLGYIAELCEKTRAHEAVTLGVSTRGAIAIMSISRAYAAMNGRNFVIPDDVQTLVPYVFGHRIISRIGSARRQVDALLDEVVAAVTVPSENWER